MRSFTNQDGEKIIVSKDHLETAVRVKKELQKASPSRRCSWNLLASLMQKEGFPEAENSESYRCLIKAYQKEIGELPEVAKHADMVASSKLESIKELVGEIQYEKQENIQYLRQINKGKRELINFSLIAEQIRDAFQNYDFSSLQFSHSPPKSITQKKMVVCLSDLHIGAQFENKFNSYSYDIAKNRLEKYLHKVVEECNIHKVQEVLVVNLGDVIEHSYMHNLGFNTEFSMSEQIVRATDLIIKFLIGLSSQVPIVRYAGIAGNHDRIHENKDKNLDGDHVVKAINYSIKEFIANAQIQNILYEQAKDYDYSTQIHGRYIKFIHGDRDSMKDEALIARHSLIDNIGYDLIVMGHYHNHREIEVGIDKRIAVFGSLKGVDDYAMRIRKLSAPSQGIIIIDETGEIVIKRIELGTKSIQNSITIAT
ncbi:metallophosphoesterase [Thermoactinomyces sp. DSM 45892]|uniref:metallophosphoesterase n=1 Tax=Thermoactinomyces sp. DSM 45892 TaxID=1882753 RepID=UPI000896D3DE|nr:metallophosphoesterase [Thermoactinomyces sp. DSM 45892]SDX95165.1 Calcineurin-like phosphoesterase [Thermoactinomyces sp. DSM 45892]